MRISQASPIVLLVPALLSAAGTTTTLSSSANPAEYGHAVTLTAVVTPSTATGKVTFYDGTTVLETETLASGKAVFTTTLLASGARSLKAYYEGDSNDAASTSTVLNEQVNTVPGTAFKPSGSYSVPFPDSPLPPDSSQIGTADFNGDGKVDLAVAGNGTGSLAILLGNGDGTFQPSTNYTVGSGATSFAIGDFNGDGKPDLFVTDGSMTTYLLFGNADGTFQTPISVPSFGYFDVFAAAVGDFNNDGKLDVVVAGYYSTVQVAVALGNGDGTFQAPVDLLAPSNNYVNVFSIAVGDFNGDGKPDLVVGGEAEGGIPSVFWLLGNGDGTFQSGQTIETLQPAGIAVADLNGDGKPDVVFNGSVTLIASPEVCVLLGNGDGTFQSPLYYLGPVNYGTNLAIVDFNGDGKPDIGVAAGSGGIGILLGNGDGTFQPVLNFPGPAQQSVGIVAADFNSDGRADIATSGGSTVGILISSAYVSTTTVLSSLQNPSTYGQSVTLSAQVSPATASGTVSFYNGSTLLGTGTLVAGVATTSTSELLAGSQMITATYSGDPYDAPSTSASLTQTVLQAPTSVSITSSLNPSTFRQLVTFTARLTSPSTATGTVTFYRSSRVLGTGPLSGGITTFTTSSLAIGANSITATYNGDSNDLSSSSSVLTQDVRDPTYTALTSSLNPSTYGAAIVLTAAVTPSEATGQVNFYQGSTSLGKGTLKNGVATLSVSKLPPGEHELTASYGGNAGYSPSESPVVFQVVKK